MGGITKKDEFEEGLGTLSDDLSLKAKLNRFWLKHQQNIAWGLAVCGLLWYVHKYGHVVAVVLLLLFFVFCFRPGTHYLCSTAWISPCFKYLGERGVGAARRASWRSQALLILLSVPAFLEYPHIS